MARPAARFSQTDLTRALRAAKAVDENLAVRVLPDGSFEVYRPRGAKEDAVAPTGEWVP